MVTIRNYFRSGIIASLFIGTGSWAHWDGPATSIGEYRVTLNSVTPMAFDDNAPLGLFEEANPDIEVHTFTQAETHDGTDFVSRLFEDQPVGNAVGIGSLIYWHLDCTPSENLQLIVDVLDMDEFPAKLLAQALKALAAAGQQGRLVAAGSELLPLIGEMVKGNDRFGQWKSNGFSIGDDSGTHNITPAAPGPGAFGEPVGLDEGVYDFDFTATYGVHYSECTPANLITVATDVASADAAVKKAVDQLVGESAQQGKKKVEEKPKDSVDKRPAPTDKPGKVLEKLFRALDQFPEKIDASVTPQADVITLQLPLTLAGFDTERFFLLGAAAEAIGNGKVVLTDSLSECTASAQQILQAVRGAGNHGNPDGLEILKALWCVDVSNPPPT